MPAVISSANKERHMDNQQEAPDHTQADRATRIASAILTAILVGSIYLLASTPA